MKLPLVSFIIPVRNDAARLARCLASIGRNAYPPDRIEVLVVDNGSRDGSDVVARRWGAVVLSRPDASVAAMRNHAARIARGEVLAFVDADHEISAGWLRSAVESLWRFGVGAAGARCRAPLDGTWVQRTYDRFRAGPPGCYDTEWLGSGNLVVWRHVFERAGGFDVSLETCEDVELCGRIRRLGFRILTDDRIRNVHLGDPATLNELFRGELWRGRDNLRTTFRGRWSWRPLASGLIPAADLGMLAIVTGGLLTAPDGGLRLMAAALTVRLGLVGLRVAHMMRVARPASIRTAAQAAAVVAVYDVARALAVVARTPYRTRRQPAPRSVAPAFSKADAWTARRAA